MDKIEHLDRCFLKALRHESKITQEIIDMEGMTGTLTRHFYNNLLELPDAKYLEIGCWKGSSTCAAMYGNKAHVTVIDDFSGFGSPKDECMANLEKYKGGNLLCFIEEDCFSVISRDDGDGIQSLNVKYFNIYLFDGDHSEESQYRALKFYIGNMQNEFIYICDDWNWSSVRNGTQRAIDELKLEVVYKKEIILTTNDEHTPADIAKATWHNGMAAFVFKKPL